MQPQHPMQGHQMQPMIPAFATTNITTEHIQKYLDENKQLILAILDNQNLGKLNECAHYQAKLQQNLMYLAAIADSQPQSPAAHSQIPPNAAIQPGAHYMQQHQAQQQVAQSVMAGRVPMQYAQLQQEHQHQQQLQQQQQQQQQQRTRDIQPKQKDIPREELEKLQQLSLQAQSKSNSVDSTDPDMGRFQPMRPQFFRSPQLRGDQRTVSGKFETMIEKPDGSHYRSPYQVGNTNVSNWADDERANGIGGRPGSGGYSDQRPGSGGLRKENSAHGGTRPMESAQSAYVVSAKEEQVEMENMQYNRTMALPPSGGGSRFERGTLLRPGSGGGRNEEEALARPGSGGNRYNSEALPRPGSGGNRFEREVLPRPGSGGKRYERESLPRPGSGGNRYEKETSVPPRSVGGRYEKQVSPYNGFVDNMHDKEVISYSNYAGERYEREVISRPGSSGNRHEGDVMFRPPSRGDNYFRPSSGGGRYDREARSRPGSGGAYYPQQGFGGSDYSRPSSGGNSYEREVYLRPGSRGSDYKMNQPGLVGDGQIDEGELNRGSFFSGKQNSERWVTNPSRGYGDVHYRGQHTNNAYESNREKDAFKENWFRPGGRSREMLNTDDYYGRVYVEDYGKDGTHDSTRIRENFTQSAAAEGRFSAQLREQVGVRGSAGIPRVDNGGSYNVSNMGQSEPWIT
uniref:TSA: Wollemia nobilis Ref_Wollemi_Transcript_11377_3306 transcribed RNA sequence n=1 Tax=Wollemia nobilis TaxID=56998 RepID=A0A0C9RV68_9CONI